MRGYHIRIGYNGGGSAEKEESRWQSLIRAARNVADRPQRIVDEVGDDGIAFRTVAQFANRADAVIFVESVSSKRAK